MDLISPGIERIIVRTLVILLVATLLYIFGGKLIGWLSHKLFWRAYHKTLHRKDLEKRQNTLSGLFVNIWRILVVLIALLSFALLFLSSAQLTPLFASAGVVGVALGFGAQSLVKDFLSGLFIISENQFRVGDVIEIDGFGGTVERIGTRSTVVRDVEGNVHYFPNGIIQHVINKTMGYSVARVTVAVVPDTDIDKATEIINEIGSEMFKEAKWSEKIIEAPHYVMMGDMSATAVNLIISGKVQPSDQWSVSAEMRRRILEEFDKNGIELGLTNSPTTVIPPVKKRRKSS